MKKLYDYKKKYDALTRKCNLSGEKAIKAVEQDGYALLYVKEQTEDICLKAVEQKGYALKYVNEQMFTQETREITIAEIEEILGCKVKIIGG